MVTGSTPGVDARATLTIDDYTRLEDGDFLSIIQGGTAVTFEIDLNNDGVTAGSQQGGPDRGCRQRRGGQRGCETSSTTPPSASPRTGGQIVIAGADGLDVSGLASGVGAVDTATERPSPSTTCLKLDDGDFVRISDGTTIVTFEIDRDGDGVAAGNVEVDLVGVVSNSAAATRLRNAINGAGFGVAATGTGPRVVLAGSHGLDLSGLADGVSSLDVVTPIILAVDDYTQLADGDLLTIGDGTTAFTFEIDLAGDGVAAGHVDVDLRGVLSNEEAATRLRNAINDADFRVTATGTGRQIALAGSRPVRRDRAFRRDQHRERNAHRGTTDHRRLHATPGRRLAPNLGRNHRADV